MSSEADVGSLEALKEFRSALCRFIKDAGDALLEVDLELRRAMEWLQIDRAKYWQQQIRVRHDDVLHAKADLSRAKTTAMFGHTAGCTDQKVALRKAQLRFEEAEQKLKQVRHWIMILDREIEQFQAPSQQLANLLEGDLPRGVARLDQLITALEGYLSLAAPAASRRTPLVTSMSRGADNPPDEPMESGGPQ